MPSIEDTIRRIVREEVRAALEEWQPPSVPASPARTDLLSLREAAAFIGVAETTLRDWRTDRSGPPAVKYGRLVKYRLADLEQWVTERVITDSGTPR